jgi:hypothetical protein
MPPPNERRRPSYEELIASALERVRQIDPNLDTRPGSVVRTIIEASVSDPDYSLTAPLGPSRDMLEQLQRQQPVTPTWIERNLGLPRPQIQTAPPIRGQAIDATFIDDVGDWGNRPLTPADMERFFRQIERWPLSSNPPPMMSREVWAELMGVPEPERVMTPAQVAQARQRIMAEEDRRAFEAIDRATFEGTWAAEPSPETDDREAARTREWQMQELPGTAVINANAARRVDMPLFEIMSSPTISLEEIRQRRFNFMAREPSPPPPPPPTDTLEQMRLIAVMIRRTAWERVLDIDDLEFPT